jgi:hypothetical protein
MIIHASCAARRLTAAVTNFQFTHHPTSTGRRDQWGGELLRGNLSHRSPRRHVDAGLCWQIFSSAAARRDGSDCRDARLGETGEGIRCLPLWGLMLDFRKLRDEVAGFATTISPWVITPEALAPFRTAQSPRPAGDPRPLPYLWDERDQGEGGIDLGLEVLLTTPGLREKGLPPHRIALSSTRHMYWTVAQLIAHRTSNGCNLQPGDLFGSGTISAPEATGFGSLLEATRGGQNPIRLESGEERRFLVIGDEVILRARTRQGQAVKIGFGECRGTIKSK